MELNCKYTRSVQDKIIKELEAAPNIKLFTPFEDELIRKFYLTKGARVIAEKIGKKVKQVHGRADNLGITRKGRGKRL